MFYNILDEKRIKLLPFFKFFKKDFYLAGGTGLALQIGHRDSVDFNFFTYEKIDTKKLFIKLKETFLDFKILKIEEDENTMIVLIDGVKVSFFSYPYKLIGKIVNQDNLSIASIEDIGCMKLSAIISRATIKDYIDLYYILQKINLEKLLKKAVVKFQDIDKNLILRSLVYFKDIKQEKILFKNNNNIEIEEIEKYLKNEVKGISSLNT